MKSGTQNVRLYTLINITSSSLICISIPKLFIENETRC